MNGSPGLEFGMSEQESSTTNTIDTNKIGNLLKKQKKKMRLSLAVCAHCSLCAESCFMYLSHDKNPQYMPSHKFINSIGILYRKRGKVSRNSLEEMRDIVWKKCVLCMRCYCPFGINIPNMITLARSICRSQGVYPQYDNEQGSSLPSISRAADRG